MQAAGSFLRRVLAAGVLTGLAFNVLAQGSIIPQSQAQSPDRDPRSRKPDAPDYRLYEYGKEIYAVKLGCATCPLGDKPLDESVARKYLNDYTLSEGLTDKEQDAVRTYLKQLYSLNYP